MVRWHVETVGPKEGGIVSCYDGGVTIVGNEVGDRLV